MKTEEIEQLVLLHNARMERFDRTRTIQWGINASLWGAIVLAAGFLRTNEIYVYGGFLIIFSILVFIIHWAAIHNIQRSLDWDRKLIIKYHKVIGKNNAAVSQKIKKFYKKDNKRGVSWLVIQLGATSLICVTACTLLWRPGCIC